MHKDGNDAVPQPHEDVNSATDVTGVQDAADGSGAAGATANAAPAAGSLKSLNARALSVRGTVAGMASAVIIVAAAGSLVAAASMGPQSAGSRPLEAPLAAVPAGSNVGICPGPARLLEGTAVGTDPQFSPESATAKSLVNAAVLSTNSGALPGSRLAELNGNPLTEIAKDPGSPTASAAPPALLAGVVSQRIVDSVSVLSADAVGNQQATAGAVMSYTATDGDLQGSAAAGCQQPANDMWLVGANTSLGRTAVLNLSNASSTPATVSLELYGAQGQIQAPGSRGLLVAPGTTRSIVLAGLAPDQEKLSIHARSAGGPVTAVIQQSVLRGLTPGGVDFIVPGAAPATRQVMSGLDIQDPASAKALTAKQGFADASAALQIAVPGPADAVVEIKLYGRDGQKALPGGGVVTAKGGSVTEVSLAGVPAGQYTVAASSDVSFAAAARLARGLKSDSATDFAWSAASARLGSQHVVTVPRGGERYLVFGAPGDRAKITYTPVTADGKVRAAATADIAGGTTTVIKVPAEVDGAEVLGYVVSASGDAAYGTVLLEENGRADVATVAVAPGAAGQEQVAVKLGY
ncbi:hypothetical protein Arth_1194 [Arthrobacter sp. FB24]|uniref:DUF5719 family protein n=1 Tax=Arthrobacter sp. (strain FB24) TaxID=290399 RepID=UPI0000526EE2|nr:DUF5719 family protein [Arthrobacter sp. FB24]ABK02588.1 hypothetical protein Arth_1194 [Arthrobacter sp. FB24]